MKQLVLSVLLICAGGTLRAQTAGADSIVF